MPQKLETTNATNSNLVLRQLARKSVLNTMQEFLSSSASLFWLMISQEVLVKLLVEAAVTGRFNWGPRILF